MENKITNMDYQNRTLIHITVFSILISLLFSACSPTKTVLMDGAPETDHINYVSVPDAIPQYEIRTRAGNPDEYEVLGEKYRVLSESTGYSATGIASWYGTKFHGKKTSNGEIYDMYRMTAAHKSLPIPSYVKVTNLSNEKSVIVRINDRGPFHENRIIDLSYVAAKKLAMQKAGTAKVKVEAIDPELFSEQQAKLDINQQSQKDYYLQIGAFSQLANAELIQNKLFNSEISNIRIKKEYTKNNTFFKVQIGPVRSIQNADNLNQKLSQLGYKKIQVVKESQ